MNIFFNDLLFSISTFPTPPKSINLNTDKSIYDRADDTSINTMKSIFDKTAVFHVDPNK